MDTNLGAIFLISAGMVVIGILGLVLAHRRAERDRKKPVFGRPPLPEMEPKTDYNYKPIASRPTVDYAAERIKRSLAHKPPVKSVALERPVARKTDARPRVTHSDDGVSTAILVNGFDLNTQDLTPPPTQDNTPSFHGHGGDSGGAGATSSWSSDSGSSSYSSDSSSSSSSSDSGSSSSSGGSD